MTDRPQPDSQPESNRARSMRQLGQTLSLAIRAGNFRPDLGIRQLLPEWRQLFDSKFFHDDLRAGLLLACTSFPLALAIGLAAGVTPETGLFTAIAAGILCSLFGGAPLIVSAPLAAMSVLTAYSVEQYGVSGLIFIVFFCGLCQLASGVFGLGNLARLIPNPVLMGFSAGIGIIIIVSQLPRALGLPPSDQSHVLDVVKHLGEIFVHMNPKVFALTLMSIGLMVWIPKVAPRVPATLVAMLVPTILVSVFSLNVETIGEFSTGFSMPPMPPLEGEDWPGLFTLGFILYGLASLGTLIACSEVEKIKYDARNDTDQEMIGQGIANLVLAFCGGIPVGGAMVRSVQNVKEGAQTRRSTIIQALVMLVVAFATAKFLGHIPIAALVGVLMVLAYRLIHWNHVRELVESSMTDTAIYAVTILAVVFADIVIGVQAGVVMALVIGASRMGNLNVHVHRAVQAAPYRVSLSGSLSFMGVRRLVDIESKMEGLSGRGVIIDLSRVVTADTSGANALLQTVASLRRQGATVVLKGVTPSIRHTLLSSARDGSLVNSIAATEAEAAGMIGGNTQVSARGRLLAGVERFSRDLQSRYEPLLGKLATGQQPHTLFICCSDSRVIPDLFTSTDPGELFVVRNVGNFVPPHDPTKAYAEGAAIEYALGVLGVKQIVVCGHSACGAIQASVSTPPAQFPNVVNWLRGIQSGLKQRGPGTDVTKACHQNILQQIENLRTYPLVREQERAGKLSLAAWFLDVGTGSFHEYLSSEDKFIPISSLAHEALES